MYNFRQIIRAETEEDNKIRILDFIGKLIIREKEPYEVIVRPYKKSKTMEQLGYYWGVIIPMFCAEFGHHKDDADQFLKEELLEPKVMEVCGKILHIRPSIAKMKVNEMSEYIDKCIDWMGMNGVPVPPPTYRG